MTQVPEEMDLQTFVRETLVQIVAGVELAISDIKGNSTNAMVNPYRPDANHSDPTNVEFDVAVTVTDSSSGRAGGGIKILSFNVGAHGEGKIEAKAVNRIKFSVPVALPGHLSSKYKRSPDMPRQSQPSDGF